MELIIKLTALVFSIVFHEVAHGYAAYRLGDPTAKAAGRLTLNPLAHIDPMGSVILPLMLVLMKSPMLFGWAKAVPFNPAYFRNPKTGTMIVGAAGPAANFTLALGAAMLLRILDPGGILELLLGNLCVINVVLAVFNLIPIPPLDGSRVVIGLLPAHMVSQYLRLERFGFLIIFGLLYLGVLDRIIWPIALAILRLLFLK